MQLGSYRNVLVGVRSYFNSNSDCKPNGHIVICRTFHTLRSRIQIPILTADYKNGLESGSELKSASVNVNKPFVVWCNGENTDPMCSELNGATS